MYPPVFQAGKLPTYVYNRLEYTVDYRCKQFRICNDKYMRFYNFDSPEGDRILTKMIRDGVADLSKLNL